MTAAKTVQRSHAALLEAQSPSWAAIHEATPKRGPGGAPPLPGHHRRPIPLQDPTTELILRGVPYTDSESHQALQDYISALAQYKGLELRPTDYTALRAIAKPALASRRNGTHPKIIIKLSSNLLKTKLKARAKGEGTREPLSLKHLGNPHWSSSTAKIYLSENLTPAQAKLFYHTRLFKRANLYKFAWTRNGYCYLRKAEGDQAIPIHTMEDLSSLLRQQKQQENQAKLATAEQKHERKGSESLENSANKMAEPENEDANEGKSRPNQNPQKSAHVPPENQSAEKKGNSEINFSNEEKSRSSQNLGKTAHVPPANQSPARNPAKRKKPAGKKVPSAASSSSHPSQHSSGKKRPRSLSVNVTQGQDPEMGATPLTQPSAPSRAIPTPPTSDVEEEGEERELQGIDEEGDAQMDRGVQEDNSPVDQHQD